MRSPRELNNTLPVGVRGVFGESDCRTGENGAGDGDDDSSCFDSLSSSTLDA
jgi:hypothetical protein